MAVDQSRYTVGKYSLQYNPAEKGLEQAIDDLVTAVSAGVRSGQVLIVLSDVGFAEGVLPIHALLATGAVHHSLTHAGLRCDANIIVETATARDPHHVAALIGYGAT